VGWVIHDKRHFSQSSELTMDTKTLAQLRRELETEQAELIATLTTRLREDWERECDNLNVTDLIKESQSLPGAIRCLGDRLEKVDASLCAMDLEIYGLCADCESQIPLSDLMQDAAEQRCPQCRTSNYYHHDPAQRRVATDPH
jgi:RNA polymerase-binding transcription factor DksA